jgi:uncharacterized membrane protein (DUF2068 family)
MAAATTPETARATPPSPPQLPSANLVYVLGVYLLAKSLVLAVIGTWIAQPVHPGSAATSPTQERIDFLLHIISYVHLDPHGHFLGKILDRLGGIQTKELQAIRWGCWFYAALHIVEGIGLIGRWRWGEWMVVIATTALIPYELWHVGHHPSWAGLSVIIINVAIALYFVHRLRIHAEKAIHLRRRQDHPREQP